MATGSSRSFRKNRAASGSEIRVVYLEHADAEQLLPVLQQLLGQPVTQPTSSGRSFGGGESAVDTMRPGLRARPQPQQVAAAAPAGEGEAAVVARNAVVTRFEGANAIVIAATPDVQRTLGEVIRQLDVRRQQVSVEAIIVELSEVT